MRIETREETDLPHVALLNDAEARALSRSADAVPGWLAAGQGKVRGIISWTEAPGARIMAAFPDEGALKEFLMRFLPGAMSRGCMGPVSTGA